MLAKLYGWMTNLPAKLTAGAVTLLGLAAALWTDKIRTWIEGATAERLSAASIIAFAMAALYFFLLWLLKPTGAAPVAAAQAAKRLTSSQKAKLTQALIGKFAAEPFSLMRDNSSRSAVRLAQDFEEVLAASGWTGLTHGGFTGAPRYPASGIGVVINDPANILSNTNSIMAALKAAGLDFDIMTGAGVMMGDGLFIADPE